MTTPFEVLNLPTTATADEIKSRWRELAGTHHPDRGGDATTFHTMRQAYQAALKLADRPKKCPECNGAGKIQQRSGFHTIMVMCPTCKGAKRQ